MNLNQELTVQLLKDIKTFIDAGYTKSRKSPHHNKPARDAYSTLTEEEQTAGEADYKKDLENHPTIVDMVKNMEDRPEFYKDLTSTVLNKSFTAYPALEKHYAKTFPAISKAKKKKVELIFSPSIDVEDLFGEDSEETTTVETTVVENPEVEIANQGSDVVSTMDSPSVFSSFESVEDTDDDLETWS